MANYVVDERNFGVGVVNYVVALGAAFATCAAGTGSLTAVAVVASHGRFHRRGCEIC